MIMRQYKKQNLFEVYCLNMIFLITTYNSIHKETIQQTSTLTNIITSSITTSSTSTTTTTTTTTSTTTATLAPTTSTTAPSPGIPTNSLELQFVLAFVLICVIGLLFLSIQAFVEYEKFQQLYGDELNFRIIFKNLFKSIIFRIMVFRQKKSFFKKAKDLKQTQFEILKTIVKNADKIDANDEFKLKAFLQNVRNEDIETVFRNKIPFTRKDFYLQSPRYMHDSPYEARFKEKQLSLNTLNWLCEKPHVFYGESFSYFTYAVPDRHPRDGMFVGSGYFKLKIYGNNSVPMKLYDHGLLDEDFCYYTQTVYALSRLSITVMHCHSVYVLYRAFSFITHDWMVMCDSIEKGVFLFPTQLQFRLENTFQNQNGFQRFVNEKLSNILKPNPKRANELRSLFRRIKNADTIDTKSIAVKIWPTLEFVMTNVNGTLNCQLSIIRDYLSKTVKIISHMHSIDSRILLGYSMHRFNVESNTQSEEAIYVPTYDHIYFEYIDVDLIRSNVISYANAIGLSQVKLNKEYEIVITDQTSHCRYRTGEVIKFVRVHDNSIPVYVFQYKIENVLNISNIYLDERLILKKLNLISQFSKCFIVDYTTCVYDIEKLHNTLNPNIKIDSSEQEFYRKAFTFGTPSCFILFIEFKAIKNTECSLKMKLGIADLFDEYICNSNKEYALCRKVNKIDKFRVYELRTGAFDLYKSYLLNEKYKRTGKVEISIPKKLTDFNDAGFLYNLKLD